MTLATPGPWSYLAPILLLVCSNLFMTIAWWLYFDQPLSWTQGAGFALIALGALLVFKGNP